MDEEMGNGLKMKIQDELIGKDGVYQKRFKTIGFSAPAHTTSDGCRHTNNSSFYDTQKNEQFLRVRSLGLHSDLVEDYCGRLKNFGPIFGYISIKGTLYNYEENLEN
ncbi:hypothetical protein RhiirA4_474544 [Rhizophagus irregularis]|uniref:Uncharacterized protein n=1 Tax=Rhizophagus irregularis TaxID=588596 RepID=A0A2I1H8L5_9GLOM|nr:hypothetical protein RhiirA4_474544 [Rhizophagus irregularis]